MSRGFTPRHAQTAADLGFAVQLNAETKSKTIFEELKVFGIENAAESRLLLWFIVYDIEAILKK